MYVCKPGLFMRGVCWLLMLLLTPMFSGYRDFQQECERRGPIVRPFTAKQAYEQMSPYLDRLFNEVEKKKMRLKNNWGGV